MLLHINSSLSIKTSTVSDTGLEFTYYANVLRKSGNMVNIQLSLYRESGIPDNTQAICSIPEDYRPIEDQMVLCQLVKPNWTGEKTITVTVGKDGLIKISYGVDVTEGFVTANISGTWITN